jgi:hypothetical protein
MRGEIVKGRGCEKGYRVVVRVCSLRIDNGSSWRQTDLSSAWRHRFTASLQRSVSLGVPANLPTTSYHRLILDPSGRSSGAVEVLPLKSLASNPLSGDVEYFSD